MTFQLIAGVLWATVLLWLAGLVLTLRGIARKRVLDPNAFAPPPETLAPLVSILVPARNEEHRVLSECLRSMLAQDYPSLEVVAVNDRSTDRTGVIMRALAENDSRLRVIDGAEPPAGWLGKPYALAQGLASARGEWILATDADMIYAPRAVSTSVAYASTGEYDALTLLPHVECFSFWERVFMPTFGWFMLLALPLERVNDPRRKEAIGVGGFFMIRRGALEKIGGYAAVRGEVAEDLRMAEELKKSGARLRLEYAPELVRTRMQPDLRNIWEGFTKNLFAGTKFSLWRTLLGSLGVLLFAVAPFFIALGVGILLLFSNGDGAAWRALFWPTLATWLLQVLIFALINKNSGVPVIYALAVPLGHALFTAILLNSTFLIVTGRGVTWKGRKLYEREGDVRPPRGENQSG
ncbi:MAG TPA: glycosyltransferase family 2 protein [Pyrinomonadaceae bacterium]|nr:glycosyltransferase family 2 protein [Pyrinomonadaceae bacterium]